MILCSLACSRAVEVDQCLWKSFWYKCNFDIKKLSCQAVSTTPDGKPQCDEVALSNPIVPAISVAFINEQSVSLWQQDSKGFSSSHYGIYNI